jgi:4a-hydroxytetrahydrobiopterin dehydratase
MEEVGFYEAMINWKEENNSLKCELEFRDFMEAWNFMTKVAEIAEELNHHPEWKNVYNKVEIRLCTHDAGSVVTQKDRQLAGRISELIA